MTGREDADATINAMNAATVAAFMALMVAFGSYQPQSETSDPVGRLVRTTSTASTAVTEPQPYGSPLPMGNFVGDPAIPVSPNAKPGLPAFGEKEVYAYFSVHPPDYWDNSTPISEVISIQFLSTREAEIELDSSIPRPPGNLLCIVKLKGSFIPRIPPGVTPTYMSTPVGGVTVTVVIDALTGNILGQGSVGEVTATTPAEPMPTKVVPAGLTYSTCLPDITPGIHARDREKGLLPFRGGENLVSTGIVVSSDGTMYEVFSGATDENVDQGVVITKRMLDFCADPDAARAEVYQHFLTPEQHGVVTLVSSAGDLLVYTTSDGYTRSFNLATSEFGPDPHAPPNATIQATVITATPTFAADMTLGSEEVNELVLSYLEAVGTVKSGVPVVLYSQPLQQQQLLNFGLAMLPFAPDCERPFHLVIVAGDFDIYYLAPGFRNHESVAFIGFVYDLEAGTYSQIMPSITGSIFKMALGDPSLPDPDPLEVQAPDLSGLLYCETVQLPFGPEPSAADTPSVP